METDNKRRALGRGLEELFNNEPLMYDKVEEKILNETPKDAIEKVKLTELHANPYQPRKVFDQEALNELADSIREHGVIQPIIVKKGIKGYEIIAGERRVKASLIAGLEEIPAIIRDFNDQEMMEIALLENLQRENLNAIEEANAYKKLQENLNVTQEELAKRLGKSRSHITNMLGILSLPMSIQKMIEDKDLSMAHARIISKLESKEQQESLANKVVKEGISVHELENLTSSQKEFVRKHKVTKKTSSEYKYLEEGLSEKLGTKVKVKSNKIEISFVNVNDLNRILEIMDLNESGN